MYFEYTQHYKKLTVKELKEFIFENYYRRIGFAKENFCYSMKHQKKKDFLLLATKLNQKMPDSSNHKQYYKPFSKNKYKKLVNQSKIITQQTKTIENLNISGTKSVT